ncbi:MAG: PEGA domain-containing protein [Lentisphaerae bacterium]|nr:PEGA domain-containing protein [Lentisphaerota bacterium]
MRKEIIGAATLALLVGITGCKSVSVSSTPAGANARSEGQSLGITPATVEVNLFKSQKVSISKDGYASKTINVTFDSPNLINVSLDREFNVKSNPSGADVYVNGEFVGKTPAEAIAMDDSGATILEVRKKGWLPAKMTVKTDTPVDVTLTMEQDGSGRRILDLVPTTDGVTVTSEPIYSDTDIGEHSPNVSSCKKLTNQSQTEFILSFSLLPDGKTLVTSILEELTVKNKTEYRANIWQLNTSIAGAPRKAVTQGDYFDIHPNPSIDGNTLYFSTTRNGRLGIWNLKLNGKGGLRTVTMGNTADYSPALKPNTEHIYYAAVLPGSTAAAYIWNKPSNGGMPEQLTEGASPQWSPDGKKLLYIKGDTKKNKARIWICDADGGNQTQLSVGSGDFNDIDARWSVDGKKIIFSSNRSLLKGKNNYDIYIMDAEGGNLTQLTTNGSHDDKPVFGPDGQTVFFRSNRGLVWDIWTMKINTGK